MEANQQIFRHSFGKIAVIALVILYLGYMTLTSGDYLGLLMVFFVFIIALFYVVSSVKISSDEITTQRLLGSKTLRWSEIGQISTRGELLRLHSRDEDLTLSIDSQVEGYPDLLDIIFSKRPDLLDMRDDHAMSTSWAGVLYSFVTALLFIVFAAIQWWLADNAFIFSSPFIKFVSLVFLGAGLVPIVKWFFSPKSLSLESNHLTLDYWFKEASHSVQDIKFISLEKQRTKNGYVYFVQINLTSGEKIKLPTFKPGVQLTYQILKRWHKKSTRRV